MKRKLFLVLILGIAVLSCGQKQGEANELNNTVSQQTTQQGQNFQNNNIQGQQSNTQSQQQQVSTSSRFGNATVGFIDQPNGWSYFKDPQATPTAMQLSKNGVDIITLDQNPAGGNNAKEAISNMYNGLVKVGFITNNNAELLNGKVNGYDALMLKAIAPDGKVLMMMFVDYNGKVYYVAVEGASEEVMNTLDIVDKSWNPEK